MLTIRLVIPVSVLSVVAVVTVGVAVVTVGVVAVVSHLLRSRMVPAQRLSL